MDENNRFLDSYKKKIEGEAPAPAPEAASPEKEPATLRYEESSGFVKPHQNGRERTPTPRRPNYLAPIIVGALVVVGIVVGLLVFLNRGIAVTDFTGWAINDAQLWASDNGFKLQVEEQYNDKVDTGKVVSQDPKKGESLNKGAFIKVLVSKGHDLTKTLELPDLMTMTKDEIDAWAAQNFMAKVRTTTEYSDTVAEGNVISFEINDSTVVGKTVTRNTPIYIVVSKGSEDQAAVLITVPDFKTKTVSESNAFAKDNGIVLEIVEQYDDYSQKGAIIGQSVKAEEKVKKGDKIILTVSKGKLITVPDFSAYSKTKAQAEATELGITVSVTEKYSSQATGKFISQSIPAGSEYMSGEVLELTYSLGNKIVIGSFVGQTYDAMETWANELNAQGASITFDPSYTENAANPGTVLWHNYANTKINVKTKIKVAISKGKTVIMPNFKVPDDGMGYNTVITRQKATDMCTALGIVPVFTPEAHAGALPGQIWYQDVDPLTEVSAGTVVKLKYVPTAHVTVHNFVGMTQQQVIDQGYMQKLDITFVTNDTHVDGYDGTICEQSLPANSTVLSGTAITLKISPP